MSELVERFLSSHGGIIEIHREPSELGSSGYYYDAWWTPDFMMSFRLGEGAMFSYDLKVTMEKVKAWDPKMRPIKDLGEYQLYARKDEDGLAVNTKQEYGCTKPIKAKKVPSGTFLAGHALDFFMYWKGRDAVDMGARILL